MKIKRLNERNTIALDKKIAQKKKLAGGVGDNRNINTETGLNLHNENSLENKLNSVEIKKAGREYTANDVLRANEEKAKIIDDALKSVITSYHGRDAINKYLETDDKKINFINAFKPNNVRADNKFIQLLNTNVPINNNETFLKLYNEYCDDTFKNIEFNSNTKTDEVIRQIQDAIASKKLSNDRELTVDQEADEYIKEYGTKRAKNLVTAINKKVK